MVEKETVGAGARSRRGARREGKGGVWEEEEMVKDSHGDGR